MGGSLAIDWLFKALALTGGASFGRQLWQDHLNQRDRLAITTTRTSNLYNQKLHIDVRFLPDHRHVGLHILVELLQPGNAYLVPWDVQTDPASVEHAVSTLTARDDKRRTIRQRLRYQPDGFFLTKFELAEFKADDPAPSAKLRVTVQADDDRRLVTRTYTVSPIN